MSKLTDRQIEELRANHLWDESTRNMYDSNRKEELKELNKKRKIRLRVKTK